LAPETDTASRHIHEYPAQLCRSTVTQSDRGAAEQLSVTLGEPDTTFGIVVEDVFGDRSRDIGLEFQAEPG
jgi:hypothetical protein